MNPQLFLQGFYHPESHAAFFAQAALVGDVQEGGGEVETEVVAVAAHTGLVGGACLDADEGGFGWAEQLEVAVWGAAEGVSVDGVVAVEQTLEDAQFVAWVGGGEVVHVSPFVAEGDADGGEGAEHHAGLIVKGRHHLDFPHHELRAGDVVGYLEGLLQEESLDELLGASFGQEGDVERHKV